MPGIVIVQTNFIRHKADVSQPNILNPTRPTFLKKLSHIGVLDAGLELNWVEIEIIKDSKHL